MKMNKALKKEKIIKIFRLINLPENSYESHLSIRIDHSFPIQLPANKSIVVSSQFDYGY